MSTAEGGAAGAAPEIDGSEGACSPDDGPAPSPAPAPIWTSHLPCPPPSAPAAALLEDIDGSADGAPRASHLSTTAVAVPVAAAAQDGAAVPLAAATIPGTAPKAKESVSDDADRAWTGEMETTATSRECLCGGLTSTHILCVCLLCVLLAVAIPLGVAFGTPSDAAAEPPLPQLPPPTASLPDNDATECSLADFSGDVYAYGGGFCYRASLGPSGEIDQFFWNNGEFDYSPSCEGYSPRITIRYSKVEGNIMSYEGSPQSLYECDQSGGHSGTVQLVIDDSIDARATVSAGETVPCRYDLTITSPSCEAVVRDLGLSWEKSLPQLPPPPEEDAPTAGLPNNGDVPGTMEAINEVLSTFSYTDVSLIKEAFDSFGYTLIATPTFGALSVSLPGAYGGITSLGQFDIDEFDCNDGYIELTDGFASDLDGHPYLLFAGFGPSGFLGTAAQIFREYTDGTELKDLFFPNQYRELYAYVLNADGTKVVDDSGSTSTIYSRLQSPGPNGYYQTNEFSDSSFIWGFRIGSDIDGSRGDPSDPNYLQGYMSTAPDGTSYGCSNANALRDDCNGCRQYFWGERIWTESYAFYFAIKKTSKCVNAREVSGVPRHGCLSVVCTTLVLAWWGTAAGQWF